MTQNNQMGNTPAPVDREEFDNEVATLVQLAHPNIVTCFGIAEDRQKVYQILEFCGGGVSNMKDNTNWN